MKFRHVSSFDSLYVLKIKHTQRRFIHKENFTVLIYRQDSFFQRFENIISHAIHCCEDVGFVPH